jgi:SOS-response transcriptional repressor LexA
MPLAGIIRPGSPVEPSEAFVGVPSVAMEPHELVYRIAEDFQHLQAGDLLIVEPRTTAASGEYALATHDGKAYVGTWWTKHKKRQLIVDPALQPIGGTITLIGVINFTVRRT